MISGTATPCVLLHGLAVSHRYLMPTAGLLGPRSVYVPDLGGFGLSDKPGTAFDVGGHADLIAALLDTLGAAPVALLGNSFGCQVAVDVALRRPDLVAALILVGPTTDPAAATARGQLGRLVRDLLHEDPRQAPILAADIRDAGPRRILQTLRYAVNDHIDAKLPALRVPNLLIRGSLDRVAPQSWLDGAAALTPGANPHDRGGRPQRRHHRRPRNSHGRHHVHRLRRRGRHQLSAMPNVSVSPLLWTPAAILGNTVQYGGARRVAFECV
jgi:pimeloyl-ACP methyl ester carboxylesterase